MPERCRASNHPARPRSCALEARTGNSEGLFARIRRHHRRTLRRPHLSGLHAGPHPRLLHRQVPPHRPSFMSMRDCPGHTGPVVVVVPALIMDLPELEEQPCSRSQLRPLPAVLHVQTSSRTGHNSTHPSLRGSSRGRTFSRREAICSVLTNRHPNFPSARRFPEGTHLTKEHNVHSVDYVYLAALGDCQWRLCELTDSEWSHGRYLAEIRFVLVFYLAF